SVTLIAKSKSAAAKSRQAQIARENLFLIQKIIALNHIPPSLSSIHKKMTTAGGAPRPSSARSQSLKPGNHADSEIPQVIPLSLPPKSHVCPYQKPQVPPAACHPLYTHDSATMGNNFADRNGGTLSFDVSNQNRRKRAQTQIVDDNKKLLRQILSARTAYSRSQYSEEEHKRLQLRRNVSKHPQHRTAGDIAYAYAHIK
uniref:Uncharacterized protein n=1 Tax=Globisporangium ultimum (strain ATCC 200006 / CBS 805.95 / DAOM BR144) TaxID=431595 RepID=K3WR44_GLOUD